MVWVKSHFGDGKVKNNFYYYINNGDFDIVWLNVLMYTTGHLILLQQAHHFLFVHQAWNTIFWIAGLTAMTGWGITAGAHRLWAHRSYSAAWPLRLFLMLGHTMSGQFTLYIWVRLHRVHHKWSDTDGDPHSTNRGFFFAHIGWLCKKRHPECLVRLKSLDYSDLRRDPIIMFQEKYYWPLYAVFSFFIPFIVPVYFWSENWWTAVSLCFIGRQLFTAHGASFVNSAAHMFGHRPYNRKIGAVENHWVAAGTFGEGYHNYHHEYPGDYQASELGHGLNSTKSLIDLMAKFGLAYNLRKTSQAVVEAAKEKIRHQVLNNNFAVSDDDPLPDYF
ncbi:Delta(9)-fatty-acid desaturase fat-7 [Halotydeus destructor]|nr:Delta(9)-fatty-acid desaturase fat-7 [Halotydeus destructor]